MFVKLIARVCVNISSRGLDTNMCITRDFTVTQIVSKIKKSKNGLAYQNLTTGIQVG